MSNPAPGTAASARAAAVRPPAVRPGSPSPLGTADLRALRDAVSGQVLVEGDPGFDAFRGLHNTHYSRKPAAIVRPADAIDVSRVVLTARELGLELAVKSGGHSVAGHSATDGGILIDMRTLNAVDIDPIRWIGSAQGGTTAGEYTLAAHAHGMATPFGDTTSVGLGGLTLGGGIGWLTRRHGMTIDNLLEADIVTADGRLVTVSEESDPDLFWAIRGGGGNFGIVTRFRYRLHPVEIVTGGALFLPVTRDVLRGLIDASIEAPEALTQISFVMPMPPAPFVPAELVGTPSVVVMPVFSGPLDEAAAALAPFRSLAKPLIDMVGPMPYPAQYQFTAGGEAPSAGVLRSSFLPDLTDGAIDAIVERHTTPSPVTSMLQLRVLGGAMARVPVGATAFAHREASVMASVITGTTEDRYAEALASTEAYHAALSEGSTGVYSNFLADEGAGRLAQAYPGATYERLVQVKRRVDPHNVFHGNHNIDPR
ncbi:MAG TPA: FAD-binding oxidoreductase [Candidatus Limnocylindrales bacterium]|jgi:FAD/FMN-containing dehydrogenase